MNIKIGFMPEFLDLIKEIEFAKKYFDFIEITLPAIMDLDNYNPTSNNSNNLENYVSALEKFPVYGHIHWGYDISNTFTEIETSIGTIQNIIDKFRILGTKFITIHPSKGYKGKYEELLNQPDWDKILQNNYYALNTLNAYCQEQEIALSIENIEKHPFNVSTGLLKLLTNTSISTSTIDTGHIERYGEESLDHYLNMISGIVKHAHIHDVVDGIDHRGFVDYRKMNQVLSILNLNGVETATLEIFDTYNKQNRHEQLIEHLRYISR